ncbi:MAG TPA: hypothetical protein VMR14_00325 [Streptosporangiaceae bacterium]|nr:hypothetical protein [Streptosporangiaceae bacterium]
MSRHTPPKPSPASFPRRPWLPVYAVAALTLATAATAITLSAAHGRASSGEATVLAHARLVADTMTEIKPGTSLSSVHPAAGRTYAFARGATYTGTLSITASNVTIRNYGTGRYPVFSRSTEGNDVQVSGSNDRVSNLRLIGHGYQAVPGCGQAKTADYEVGIDITGSHDTVHAVLAYGNLYAGAYVERAGSYATISGSNFTGVNALDPGNLGSGAFGVLLWGDHNTIDGDIFDNQSTCSPDYGTDGSGVEIYHGSYNLITRNTGRNDSDFTELGGAGATGNSYTDNSFAAPGQFLVTRGSGDTSDGPVYKTTLTGNVAHGSVVSYDWRSGDGTLLTMKGNHVASLSTDGGYVNAGGNVIGF